MQLRLGYTIELTLSQPMAVVVVTEGSSFAREGFARTGEVQLFPEVQIFGNRCVRFQAPEGTLRLSNSTLLEDSGDPDPIPRDAPQHAIEQLPPDVLQFPIASRYCEVDQPSGLAWQLFGNTPEDLWMRSA